jgi:hypothetical protein
VIEHYINSVPPHEKEVPTLNTDSDDEANEKVTIMDHTEIKAEAS